MLSTGPKSFAFLPHLQQILPSVNTTWPLGAIPQGSYCHLLIISLLSRGSTTLNLASNGVKGAKPLCQAVFLHFLSAGFKPP